MSSSWLAAYTSSSVGPISARRNTYAAALEPVREEVVFPRLPLGPNLTSAPEEVDLRRVYIKRPKMECYDDFYRDAQGANDILARLLLGEALALEKLQESPHPHIVRYHGARVRRGRVTGLVLQRHAATLGHRWT